jgi:hypothetical protein
MFLWPTKNSKKIGSKMDISDRFIEACKEGDLSAAKEYINQGANIHAWNDIALRWAVIKGYLDVVEYLKNCEKTKKPSSANVADDAFQWVKEGHSKISEYLKNRGNPKNPFSAKRSTTADNVLSSIIADDAFRRCAAGHAKISEYLKNRCAKLKKTSNQGSIVGIKEFKIKEFKVRKVS